MKNTTLLIITLFITNLIYSQCDLGGEFSVYNPRFNSYKIKPVLSLGNLDPSYQLISDPALLNKDSLIQIDREKSQKFQAYFYKFKTEKLQNGFVLHWKNDSNWTHLFIPCYSVIYNSNIQLIKSNEHTLVLLTYDTDYKWKRNDELTKSTNTHIEVWDLNNTPKRVLTYYLNSRSHKVWAIDRKLGEKHNRLSEKKGILRVKRGDLFFTKMTNTESSWILKLHLKKEPEKIKFKTESTSCPTVRFTYLNGKWIEVN